ncbi:MAG: RNase adapter RapZ [Lachnospiraceae bacterium]|nr:RNase adapter RapZ [Lachnospiraceae bacterium]
MRFVIVTGMSGAGKMSVMKMLEDVGYYCVDNLPIQFVERMADSFFEKKEDSSNKIKKLALGVDVRSGKKLAEMENILCSFREKNYKYEILFLESSNDVLVKRFKETRRTHPLTGVGRMDKGIEIERERLAFLKAHSDYIIDTSHLLIRELKEEINRIFVEGRKFNNFYITVLSFGFKYGIPADSDIVFDVRFLENPYYIPELKHKTGNDKEVYDFVMKSDEAKEFLKKLEEMLVFLIPNYIKEGKNQLVISIGCTGGQHRSVTLAKAITDRLEAQDYSVRVEHRDIEK